MKYRYDWEEELDHFIKIPLRLEKHMKRAAKFVKKILKTMKADKETISRAVAAARWHDVLKKVPDLELELWLSRDVPGMLPPDEMEKALKKIWHGPAAASFLYYQFGVRDFSILNAIRFHSSGDSSLDLSGQAVFISDKAEPAREYEFVEEIRRFCLKGKIKKALKLFLGHQNDYLQKKGQKMHPRSQAMLLSLNGK